MARKSTVINRDVFENSVKEAEKNGGFKTLSELYDVVAQIYTLAVIALGSTVFCTPTLAKKFLNEWEIETKTEPGRKGRPAKESFLAVKLATLREACGVIMADIPEEFHELIQGLIEIIDEQPETTSETAEIEEETLPPIMPEEQQLAA